MHVGFAGSGRMAGAIARGLARAEVGTEMRFADSGSGRAADLAAELGGVAAPMQELASGSDLILLATKPAALEAAAEGLSGYGGPLVSVLGATTTERLQDAFPEATVLRTMPNIAVELGRGVICHAPAGGDPSLIPALELLATVATLIELPEEQLDAATALMGCSPAYFALAAEALIDRGVAAGLDRDRARELVALAVLGTGELMRVREPAELREAVASPGGSTEAGLGALAEADARAAFAAAFEASMARMRGEH